ncbi:flagellar hook-associated protein FlgK [Thalassobaculum sp.]|uniref:flagellar hook-associated protein FlgK n=1 Tax=Thalassobaculum sp. TaxID=2022740 RepID=UPI003B5BD2FC
MSLLSALTTATSGLNAAQAGIDIASRNITNANVDGYTKKTQTQTTRIIDGQSSTVRIEQITRLVNAQLQTDVRNQTSTVEELKVIDDFLGRLELEFGRPEDNASISAKITDLKKSFQVLATNPDSSTAQADVLRAATAVAESFQSLSGAVQDLRAEADTRISESVDNINEALANIEKLNGEIGARSAVGESTADLEDERDRWVAKLAEEMDIRTFDRPDGTIAIMTGGSDFLLDQTAVTITFTPTNTVGPDVALNAVFLDNGYNAPFSINGSINSGKLGGLLELRDTILPLAQDQLDSLAFELAQQFDTINVGGNTANIDLFVDAGNAIPGGDQGFSAQIQVNPTVTATPSILRDGNGGTFTASGVSDNSLALAVIDMFDNAQAFVAVNGLNGTATIEEFAAELVSYQANQKADYESQLGFQNQVRNLLEERLRDESGVNVDEELASLIQLESAFAASARVLSSVQDALDELLGVIR